MVKVGVRYSERAQVIPSPLASGSIEETIDDCGNLLRCSADATHGYLGVKNYATHETRQLHSSTRKTR
jgi:hypothetical protein